MTDQEKFSNIVNQSGFPFQIGIEASIRKTQDKHGWKVIFSEHSWHNSLDGSTGFVELVLEDQHGTSLACVECKRVLNADWIFLVSDPKQLRRRHAKAFIACYQASKPVWFDWSDIALEPITPESSYCVIPGYDAKARPLLERAGADLVSATEALAFEEQRLQADRTDSIRIFYSVLVTTATLRICEFDAGRVDLAEGKIDVAAFSEVPYLRFRKQLSSRLPDGAALWETPSDLANAKAHTIFVVNASNLFDFLVALEVDDSSVKQFDRY